MATKDNLRRVAKLEKARAIAEEPVNPMFGVIVSSREELEQLRALEALPPCRDIEIPDEWMERPTQSVSAAEFISFLQSKLKKEPTNVDP